MRGGLRTALALAGLLALASCGAPTEELPAEVTPIGDFRMGFNIAVANDVTRAPGSREASEAELTEALRSAVEARLGRYDGDGLYHVGLRIEAYSMGRAGVPGVFAPRSVLLIALNIWDDATQEKLNPKPIRITAFENEAGPFVGSGAVRSKHAQLQALAFRAAEEVETYLRAHETQWFGPKPDRERVPFSRDPATGRAVDPPPEPDTTAEGAAADEEAPEAASAEAAN